MGLKKRFIIVGCLAFAVLLILTYSFYTEKRMYEQYLTMNVHQDMVDMKSAILNNESYFKRILADDKITNEMIEDGEQARQLIYNLMNMMQIINKNNLMNQSFSEEMNILTRPAKSLTGEIDRSDTLPLTLQRMLMTFDRLDATSYPLTPELKARIVEYRQLNNRWLKVVGEPESTEINEKDWPQFMSDLEKENRVYFQEQSVNHVDDIWRDSLNPRYEW
ncbi:MAG TPA: hypothetical protein DEF35_20525 [Paenibacillus sp.]|uniref:hypothetical protein n=1 Tax=Paenibacillus TaxID=44249 RepID=UPI000BA0EC8F|nr:MULTISPECIES: hypothetical protein [Paenibacillus]OZQ71906.1 hypothetical protein CA599_08600 [Paenibacillus taichungensis]HBU84004.1 hypothetical protein [Paenibacillus sp.]